MKKIIAFLLCFCMILPLVACGAGEAEPEVAPPVSEGEQAPEAVVDEPEKELVTLTVFGNVGIESFPWFDKFCQEKFGIKWETIPSGDGVLDAMLASGELPDMTYFISYPNFEAAALSGQLLNLDDYQDLLPEAFGNDAYSISHARTRDMVGGVYGLPTSVGMLSGFNREAKIRWDIYEDIGYPEVNNMDDYLNVLKQMQDYVNEQDPDLNAYAMGLWNNWDGGKKMRCAQALAGFFGYTDPVLSNLVEQLADGSMDPKSILDDDSNYKEVLGYLFKANQMGILDPDSITQNWDGYSAKLNAGQYLGGVYWSYQTMGEPNADDYTGLAPLMIDDFKFPTMANNPGGGTTCSYVGVGANCEHPERVLEFLNWYYSYDGVNTVYNGLEGECWNWVDGERQFTEEFVAAHNSGATYEMKDGGIYSFYTFCAAAPLANLYPDANGDGYIDATQNPGVFGTEPSNLTKAWQEVYGDYENLAAYEAANGNKHLIETSPLFAMVPAASDDILTLEARIGESLMTTSWAMVFAKDEAEFEALWDTLQKDAADMGLDQILADANERWAAAKAEADKYGIK